MALSLEDKKVIVSEVSAVAARSVSAITADYRGLTVGEMTELRTLARKTGVYLRVVRNTLARRALQGTDFECLNEKLSGPLVLAFSEKEPSSPAKLFRDFAKAHNKFEVKSLSVGGKLYESTQIDSIAKLPTKDEAISMFMSVMQAPITKLVRTLAEPQAKLVRLLAAIRDQKQASS